MFRVLGIESPHNRQWALRCTKMCVRTQFRIPASRTYPRPENDRLPNWTATQRWGSTDELQPRETCRSRSVRSPSRDRSPPTAARPERGTLQHLSRDTDAVSPAPIAGACSTISASAWVDCKHGQCCLLGLRPIFSHHQSSDANQPAQFRRSYRRIIRPPVLQFDTYVRLA